MNAHSPPPRLRFAPPARSRTRRHRRFTLPTTLTLSSLDASCPGRATIGADGVAKRKREVRLPSPRRPITHLTCVQT